MNIAITGAVGLLGSALFREMAARGRDVVGLTRARRLAGRGGRWARADLADALATRALLDRLQPRCIVHCAAITDVDWCESHAGEAERFNVGVTRELAAWARDNGARFIHISTDAVFEGTRGGYTEDDATGPVNVYARTKLASEAAAQGAPDSLVIRTNLYGWNVGGKERLCEWAAQRLGAGETVPGFTDTWFSPHSTPDLARHIDTLVESPLRGIFHLVPNDGVSKFDFLRLFAQGLGYSPERVVPRAAAEMRFAAPRPMNTVLRSCRLGEAAFGPMPSVAEALARFTRAGRPVAESTIEITGDSP